MTDMAIQDLCFMRIYGSYVLRFPLSVSYAYLRYEWLTLIYGIYVLRIFMAYQIYFYR